MNRSPYVLLATLPLAFPAAEDPASIVHTAITPGN